jgi:hypothetical protein
MQKKYLMPTRKDEVKKQILYDDYIYPCQMHLKLEFTQNLTILIRYAWNGVLLDNAK